jgi:glutamate--cysteine ligase
MEGRLPALADETATLGDFADHMTTVFTDVRLKRFLEMRGADAGSPAMMLAQSALWVGLLYDEGALAAALDLLRGVGVEAVSALRAAVPRAGMAAPLAAPWPARSMRALAKQTLAIARAGLAARARRDAAGHDEAAYLEPLEAIAEGGPNQAEHWLSRYRDAWAGDAGRALSEAAV